MWLLEMIFELRNFGFLFGLETTGHRVLDTLCYSHNTQGEIEQFHYDLRLD